MKQLLNVVGHGLRAHGAPAAAAALAVPVRSVWPAVAILIVVLGHKLCEAAMPALEKLLLTIADEVGPAVGEELRTGFQAWCERRRRRRSSAPT
jgi:hypothetical protein